MELGAVPSLIIRGGAEYRVKNDHDALFQISDYTSRWRTVNVGDQSSKYNAYGVSHPASRHDIQSELIILLSNNEPQGLEQKTLMGFPSAWSAKHLLVAISLHHDVVVPRFEDACESGSALQIKVMTGKRKACPGGGSIEFKYRHDRPSVAVFAG